MTLRSRKGVEDGWIGRSVRRICNIILVPAGFPTFREKHMALSEMVVWKAKHDVMGGGQGFGVGFSNRSSYHSGREGCEREKSGRPLFGKKLIF